MIVFPNCKINLGLRILRKRADGFHDLETIFYPVPVTDVLEVHLTSTNSENIFFTQTGFPITGPAENNSCIKAYQLLKSQYSSIKGLHVHLHKNIPTGAGLGGGSSDSVAMLQVVKDLCQLPLSQDELANYALQLGSDCPFFLLNKPAIATGRGEVLNEISLSLKDYHLLLINPGISVSTAEAFSGCIPNNTGKSLATIIQAPIENWKKELHNQFEETVFLQHPVLASIKNELYESGAIYASMSGSGSTLFGIFPASATPPYSLMKKFPWTRWLKLS